MEVPAVKRHLENMDLLPREEYLALIRLIVSRGHERHAAYKERSQHEIPPPRVSADASPPLR